MSKPNRREVEHEITIEAPASEVYRMLAEVENWPIIFPPSIYVDCVERNGDEEDRKSTRLNSSH